MARVSGPAMRLRPLSRLMRFRPAALHSLEQYLTMRLGAANSLPHSLQFRVRTSAISLSALALHRLQWIGRAAAAAAAAVRRKSAAAQRARVRLGRPCVAL